MARMMLLRSAISEIMAPPPPHLPVLSRQSQFSITHPTITRFHKLFQSSSSFVRVVSLICASSVCHRLLLKYWWGNQLHNTLSQSSRSSYQDCDCKCTSFEYFDQKIKYKMSCRMDNDLNATFEACNNFNKKLKDTIKVEAKQIWWSWKNESSLLMKCTLGQSCTYLEANLFEKPYPPTLRRQSYSCKTTKSKAATKRNTFCKLQGSKKGSSTEKCTVSHGKQPIWSGLKNLQTTFCSVLPYGKLWQNLFAGIDWCQSRQKEGVWLIEGGPRQT